MPQSRSRLVSIYAQSTQSMALGARYFNMAAIERCDAIRSVLRFTLTATGDGGKSRQNQAGSARCRPQLIGISTFTMANFRLKRFVTPAGLGLSALVLVGTVGLTVQALFALGRAAEREQEIRAGWQALAGMRLSLAEAETGRRGYALTGETWHLDAYRTADAALATQIGQLEPLMRGRWQQSDRFERLQQLVQQRLDLLAASLAAYERNPGDRAAQLAFTNQGKILHDQIRVLLAQIAREVESEGSRRDRPLLAQAQQTVALAFAGCSFSLALFLFAAYRLARRRPMQSPPLRTAAVATDADWQPGFEQAGIALAHLDLRGGFLRANSAFSVWLGYATAELQQLTLGDILPQRDLDAMLSGLRQLLSGQRSTLVLESDYRGRDGRTVTGRTVISLARRERGTPVYFVSAVTPTAAEAASPLATLTGSPDLLLQLDRDGYCRDCQPAAGQSLLARRDWRDRHLRDLLPPALAEPYLQALQQALATGTVQCFEQECEQAGIQSWQEVRLAASGPDAVLAIARDITARHQVTAELAARAEAAEAGSQAARTEQQQLAARLHEIERRWRVLLESSHLVAVGLDLQGRIEYANPCCLALTGYSERELLGREWPTLIPPAQQPALRQLLASLHQQEQLLVYDGTSLLARDGTECALVWSHLLLQDPQTQPLGTLSIGFEPTRHSTGDRPVDDSLAIVGKALQVPLVAAREALAALVSEDTLHQSPDDRALLQAAERVQHAAQLVTTLVTLEQWEAGQIPLDKTWVNGGDLVAQAAAQSQPQADRARITLNIVPMTLELYADAAWLVRVLVCLLRNAITFSPPGTTVRLSLDRGELFAGLDTHSLPQVQQFAIFSVEDRGCGIVPEQLDRLFERFYCLDSAAARQQHGSGLSLALCRRIVECHNGRIWAESQPNAGSTFSFTVPICTEEEVNEALDEQPTIPALG